MTRRVVLDDGVGCGLAVCAKPESHTEPVGRDLAVCAKLESHTEPVGRSLAVCKWWLPDKSLLEIQHSKIFREVETRRFVINRIPR